MSPPFNQTKVELKLKSIYISGRKLCSFNQTKVELKFPCPCKKKRLHKLLIRPKWN